MQVQNFTASQLPRQAPPAGKGSYAPALKQCKKPGINICKSDTPQPVKEESLATNYLW